MIKTIKHTLNIIRHHLRDLTTGGKRSSQWHTVEKHFLAANPKCAVCETTEHPQIHHKSPFHLFPEKELDLTNLITLCMKKGFDCHLLVGHGSSFKAYNPNIELDAAKARNHPELLPEIIKEAKLNRKMV